jgi:hypothetical protein
VDKRRAKKNMTTIASENEREKKKKKDREQGKTGWSVPFDRW